MTQEAEELLRRRVNTYWRRAAWAFHAGYELEGWLQLFRAEDLRTQRQASAAQQRQRKLASVLWRLEGAIRQVQLLRSEITILGNVLAYQDCWTAIDCLERLSSRVRTTMRHKEHQS